MPGTTPSLPPTPSLLRDNFTFTKYRCKTKTTSAVIKMDKKYLFSGNAEVHHRVHKIPSLELRIYIY